MSDIDLETGKPIERPEAIRQAIRSLLRTGKGERVFRADIGVSFQAKDGTVIPIDGLTIQPFYSFSQATFGTYQSAAYGDLSGTQFFFVPKNKWGISAQYQLPLDAAVGDVSIAANYSYQEHTTSSTPGT